MASRPSGLTPVAFLQAFTTRAVKLAQQLSPANAAPACIESLGLAASHELEERYRAAHGVQGRLDAGQYAQCIVGIKNEIGGLFSSAPSPPGTVRVISHRCPFGEAVKEAPELCRMTAGVFGAIAARNFGHARVELRKRIATHDGMCDICIDLAPDSRPEAPGDTYRCEDGVVVPSRAAAPARPQPNRPQVGSWARDHGVVAESEAMCRALRAVEVVAPTTASVLIKGETGVGKEVLARALHAMSQRRGRPFIAVNCGAIPESLIESYLFGHERGAFTGAYEVRHGVFERADQASLFLDELDCLPPQAQARLLRVLQNGEFERVGGRDVLHADVRVISALNGDIDALVEQGGFRRDLYYRLNVVPIHIPPLRERPEDLTALTVHLLKKLAGKHQASAKVLGERAWLQLLSHTWPGNVRELENVLERAFLFATGPVIEELDLAMAGRGPDAIGLDSMKKKAADAVERKVLREVLLQCRGNVTAAARRLKISPRALHQKLHHHGMSAARFRQAAKN